MVRQSYALHRMTDGLDVFAGIVYFACVSGRIFNFSGTRQMLRDDFSALSLGNLLVIVTPVVSFSDLLWSVACYKRVNLQHVPKEMFLLYAIFTG